MLLGDFPYSHVTPRQGWPGTIPNKESGYDNPLEGGTV